MVYFFGWYCVQSCTHSFYAIKQNSPKIELLTLCKLEQKSCSPWTFHLAHKVWWNRPLARECEYRRRRRCRGENPSIGNRTFLFESRDRFPALWLEDQVTCFGLWTTIRRLGLQARPHSYADTFLPVAR